MLENQWKNSTQHRTDVKLAIALSKYLTGKRVASFGDGPGKKIPFFFKFKIQIRKKMDNRHTLNT